MAVDDRLASAEGQKEFPKGTSVEVEVCQCALARVANCVDDVEAMAIAIVAATFIAIMTDNVLVTCSCCRGLCCDHS